MTFELDWYEANGTRHTVKIEPSPTALDIRIPAQPGEPLPALEVCVTGEGVCWRTKNGNEIYFQSHFSLLASRGWLGSSV